MSLHTTLFNKHLKVSFLNKHGTKYPRIQMFAGTLLDWAALSQCLKSITSASAPHIHQYLMSVRSENQICKSEALQGVFYISYYWYMFHSHLERMSPSILTVSLCLKVATSLCATAKGDNDILK